MAKYFGFINGQDTTIDFFAASDAEKTAIAQNSNATWVSVSDADFDKGHNSEADFHLAADNTIVWDVDNDGSFESSKAVVQGAIDFDVSVINSWLNSNKATDATQKTAWQSYVSELENLDLDSTTTTFPVTGNSVIKVLADNGDITEFRNIKRLP
jgi:hypothetical protein